MHMKRDKKSRRHMSWTAVNVGVKSFNLQAYLYVCSMKFYDLDGLGQNTYLIDELI